MPCRPCPPAMHHRHGSMPTGSHCTDCHSHLPLPLSWPPLPLPLCRYTEKVDVYSFGIIMWELIARQEPYGGQKGVQIAYAAAEQGMRPKIPDDCPPEYSELMQQCWASSPGERPTFQQILKRLFQLKKACDSKEQPSTPPAAGTLAMVPGSQPPLPYQRVDLAGAGTASAAQQMAMAAGMPSDEEDDSDDGDDAMQFTFPSPGKLPMTTSSTAASPAHTGAAQGQLPRAAAGAEVRGGSPAQQRTSSSVSTSSSAPGLLGAGSSPAGGAVASRAHPQQQQHLGMQEAGPVIVTVSQTGTRRSSAVRDTPSDAVSSARRPSETAARIVVQEEGGQLSVTGVNSAVSAAGLDVDGSMILSSAATGNPALASARLPGQA